MRGTPNRHAVGRGAIKLTALAFLLMTGCGPERENRERIASQANTSQLPADDADCIVIVDFEKNSDRLDWRARRMVRLAAQRAKRNHARVVRVYGFSGDGERYRTDQLRSRVVADQLKKEGVPSGTVNAYTIADLPPSSPMVTIDTCPRDFD